MAQFTRIEVAQTMKESGMVPLFFHSDIEVAKKVLKACYDGGARLMEFTNRGDFALEVFTELTKYAVKELPGMIMGVGSVTDAGAASAYMLNGANFVVTPVLREDIAVVCNRRKVLWSPGCGSLTEIAKAEELGVEIVTISRKHLWTRLCKRSASTPTMDKHHANGRCITNRRKPQGLV